MRAKPLVIFSVHSDSIASATKDTGPEIASKQTVSSSGGSHLISKTNIFVGLVILGNFLGAVLLRAGMCEVCRGSGGWTLARLPALLNPWLILGVALMALGMVSEMALVSWADLTFVLPVTSVTYILTAFSGACFLHESISAVHWAGIVLISVGAAFVTRTPACHRQTQIARAGQ